jgi:thiol-disulfide isomerase/thioredoxin
MKRRILLGAGVGAAALAAGGGFSLYRSRVSGSEMESALWQLSFEQASGGTLSMASLRGRPLLLNFWATWCAPCIKELPMLDRFHREKQAAGWQVVGIAVDGPTPVREYLGRLPMSFPIGLGGMEGAELSRTLGNVSGSLPFTVVFAADGKILARKLGALASSDLDNWVKRANS